MALTSRDFITVSSDSFHFVDAKGALFVPTGCNYFDPETGWAPQLWQRFDAARVRRHFSLMQALGVNLVRVFLTARSFLKESGMTPAETWDKCDTLIAIAREHDIRIEFSGPSGWEGWPVWLREASSPGFDYFTNPRFNDVLENFWTQIAKRYAAEPAVFGFDLVNEPLIQAGPALLPLWQDWARRKYRCPDHLFTSWKKEFRSFDDLVLPEIGKVPEPEAMDYQLFRDKLALGWVKRMAGAIRHGSTRPLVTIGTLQDSIPFEAPWLWPTSTFDPRRTSPFLDYVSVHFYPAPYSYVDPFKTPADFSAAITGLRTILSYCQVGKPLVLEEFGWYGGGSVVAWDGALPARTEDEQAAWIAAVMSQTKDLATGWLNWAFADTPSAKDITRYSGLVRTDETVKPSGQVFTKLCREFRAAPPQLGPNAVDMPLNRLELLSHFNEQKPYVSRCAELSASGKRIHFVE